MHAPHRTHFFFDLPRPRSSLATPRRPASMAAAVSTSHHNNRRMLLASCYTLVGVLVLLSSTTCTSHAAAAAASGEYQTFIVLLERPSGAGEMDASAHRAWHESLLPSKFTEHGEPRLLRSYRFLLNGFSALLTEAELQQVASKPGFIAAFPNGVHHLDTTSTPAFLGLYDEGAGQVATWKDTDYGAGAIIDVLDDEAVEHEEKRLATWGTGVPQDLVLDPKKLAESLKKEKARGKEERDEKRKYNVHFDNQVTVEDYRMTKIRHDDPMRAFLE